MFINFVYYLCGGYIQKKILGVSTPKEAYNLRKTTPMYRGIYYDGDEFTLTSGWSEIEYYVADNLGNEYATYPCFVGLILLLSINWENIDNNG